MKKFMKEMMHSYCVLVLAALYKRVILYWLGFPIYSRSIEKKSCYSLWNSFASRYTLCCGVYLWSNGIVIYLCDNNRNKRRQFLKYLQIRIYNLLKSRKKGSDWHKKSCKESKCLITLKFIDKYVDGPIYAVLFIQQLPSLLKYVGR